MKLALTIPEAALKRTVNTVEAMKKLRDQLRAEVGELTDILESLDEGIEECESGVKDIERGLDRMSEYI